MRTRSVLLACLLVAGCESEEAELERLQFAQAKAQLQVYMYEQHISGVTKPPAPNAEDSLRAAKNRLLLADRELNKFMNGR